MQQVTVDSNLHETIMDLWQTTELRDAEGRVIGRFVPDLDAFMIRLGIDPAQEDAIAAQRLRNASGKHYTTDEVLARLREKS